MDGSGSRGRGPARRLGRAHAGYREHMSEPADEARITSRADLLPEEEAAGSENPEEQAEAILEESDERTEAPERTRHESHQTPG
jgi:hypothetical protein